MARDTGVLLPYAPLRWLGVALIAVGVVLPLGVSRWPDAERADELGPSGSTLRPEMIVLPAGTFAMGSPEAELGRSDDEVRSSAACQAGWPRVRGWTSIAAAACAPLQTRDARWRANPSAGALAGAIFC